MQFLYVNGVGQFKEEIIGLFKHIPKVRSCKHATGLRLYLWRDDKSTTIRNFITIHCYDNS